MSETFGAVGAPRTMFFRHCPIVFQGGGCRAVALAGAYRRALDAGVHPTHVAGTSAGSIMAALVGAGATPDAILEILSDTHFAEFVAPPERIGHGDRTLRLIAALAKMCRFSDYGNLLAYGGFHSSLPIEIWLNALLSQLLPSAKTPVSFRDLLIPTSVVATDLGSQSLRVWSSATTPDESVAFAVRSSCSIPIFFQPVVHGDSRLVDGGVLSNLPAFVFADSRDSFAPVTSVLALQLKGETDRSDWSPANTLHRLIDTIVAGATDVQLALHPAVHVVTIPTGHVKATDFRLMNGSVIKELVASGDSAMAAFIRTEASQFKATAQDVAYLHSEEDLYYELAAQADTPSIEVRIAAPDTVWFWKLFPTVLNWAGQGATIELCVPPPSGSPKDVKRELMRRRILTQLGATVTEAPEPHFFGFLFLRNDKSSNAAVVFTSSHGDHAPLAVRYRGASHAGAIDSLCALLPSVAGAPERPRFTPDLAHFDWSELRRRLKADVSQYSSQGVNLDIEDVAVSSLRPLTRVIRAYKYRQVEHLAGLFRDKGIPLFDCATVRLEGGASSVVTPPVIEIHGTEMFVIEGNTRTYFCHRTGLPRMRAIVVRGVQDPIPGKSVELRRVSISTDSLESADRMPGLNYSLFRHIESAAHPLS
jgi:predicted acylesterase/phospholipase RssA